ncbi:hypothetical protein BVRB_012690 [Beta vulgaris subsp. vulgaris]|uniref:Uncharacterized protein n=1 Tax=Beta vulgaris subsp. vulgaris TaxID=3555 RepID=A0A0J8DW69_BETVV|nr:hypothetical protein BVRB_012690 [Beta vulgaris subsp. vulgaris]
MVNLIVECGAVSASIFSPWPVTFLWTLFGVLDSGGRR